MEYHLLEVNVNHKLSPEQHIYLYLYARKHNHDLSYEQLVIDEQLITNYNKTINNLKHRTHFIQYLQANKTYIDAFQARFNTEPWLYAKPIIWGDRVKSAYYIENLTLSHRFEVYIDKMLEQRGITLVLFYSKDEQYNQGENALGIEIKRDIKSWETGNLYIEYAERLNPYGEWVASGIFKKDNTKYFLIGDIGRFHILRKSDLLKIYELIKANGFNEYKGIKLVKARRGTSLGFIIPIEIANKMSLSLDQLSKELNPHQAL